MTLQLTTYQRMNYYWNGYNNQEIKFEMIQFIQKDVGFAFSPGTDKKRLYGLYLKDGNKIFIDLAAFRKILKFGREQGVDVDVREYRYR